MFLHSRGIVHSMYRTYGHVSWEIDTRVMHQARLLAEQALKPEFPFLYLYH